MLFSFRNLHLFNDLNLALQQNLNCADVQCSWCACSWWDHFKNSRRNKLPKLTFLIIYYLPIISCAFLDIFWKEYLKNIINKLYRRWKKNNFRWGPYLPFTPCLFYRKFPLSILVTLFCRFYLILDKTFKNFHFKNCTHWNCQSMWNKLTFAY